MRIGVAAALPCLLIAASLLSVIQLAIVPSSAQPTWNFSIELLPAELYMGERGSLKANITNLDCSSRMTKPYEVKFSNIPERDLESILTRAREMNESGWITNYDLVIEDARGYGGQVHLDAKLSILGACSGRSIKLYYAQLWFPWKKYPGRDWAFRADANVELKAFNPIDYILRGISPGSSIVLEFKIFIPPDIYPEERFLKPVVDLRAHYPGWIDYTFEAYPTRGPFEIQPYRSFNLTIMDYDGVRPLAGAQVIIRRLIHYYDAREYIAPENGTIRIRRLMEGDYEVRVYWNSSSFSQESPLLHMGHHTAYDLASEGIRALVFNVEVKAVDLGDRPLKGARILLDGVEVIAEDGSALFELVPNGNHSIQAYWMNVKLLDYWIWVGYHPTISPEIGRQSFVLKLPVDDLLVQAVDSGGAPIPAIFMISDPRGALPDLELYPSSGLLNVSQLIVGDYLVRALNCSSAFRTCAEASGIFQPGRPARIQLPLHSIALNIYSRAGESLGNASAILGGVRAEADLWGHVSFRGIPKGEYRLKILWRGIEVYDDLLTISESRSWDIIANVYDVKLELKTADGRPISAYWIMVDSSGHRYEPGRPSGIILARQIPRGPCNLTIIDERNITLFSALVNVGDLASRRELELPVGDIIVRVLWDDGAPVAGAKVVLVGPAGLRGEGLINANGLTSFSLMPFTNYSLRVYYPGTPLLIFDGSALFAGGAVEVRVARTGIMIRIVDVLGNPLPGAAVKLHVSGLVLGEGRSGPDGFIAFSGIPHLGAYQLEVRHGPLRADRVIRPGESAVIELEAINFFGVVVPLQHLAILLLALGMAIAIPIAIILVKRRFRSSAREEA